LIFNPAEPISPDPFACRRIACVSTSNASAKRNMSDEKKPIQETAPNDLSPESDDIGVEQLKAVIAALQGDLEKKTAELAAKHDVYLRAVAETENGNSELPFGRGRRVPQSRCPHFPNVRNVSEPDCGQSRQGRSCGDSPSAAN